MSKQDLKVAIVGKASNSQMLAPFDDSSWQIWGLSNAYCEIPRWDAWFELHDWEFHRRNNMEHYEWLQKDHKKPIYAFEDKYHDAPCAKRFPIEKVTRMFGDKFNGEEQFKYWTNSPSYMMALAILQNANTIGLWGIDMAMQDEYAYQRPSCEVMIGACLAKGINVVVPPESSLCKSRRLYGYETHNNDGYVEVRTRENVLKERMAAVTQAADQAAYQRNIFEGALKEVSCFKDMNANGKEYDPEEREKIIQQGMIQANSQFEQAEKQKFIFQGALEDLSWVKTVFLT